MAGYQPVALVTNQNFYIDQTNTQGLIGPTGTFSKGYTISKGNLPCSGSMVRILNCHGVTVIETPSFPSPPNNEAYAVAGTYEDVNGEAGIFFSCLTNNGTPITPAYYEFPNAGPYTDISKPLLALAPNFGTPGYTYFYICGSYRDAAGMEYMYVLVVDEAGIVVANNEFSFAASTDIIQPKAIIGSLQTLGNLTIVGKAFDASTLGSRGFLIDMTPGSSGSPAIFNLYGQIPTSTTDEEFTSITPVNGVTDYIVGGLCDTLANGATDWFCRIDQFGVVVWSSIFSPSNMDNVGGVVGVTLGSGANGTTEIYGIAHSLTEGMVTMKLDAAGNAFIGSGTSNFNTFFNTIPNAIPAQRSMPVAIGFQYNGTGPSDGLHIFGRDKATLPSSHYLTLSYLNGQNACLPTRNPGGITTSFVPDIKVNPITNNVIVYQRCLNFLLSPTTLNPNILTQCMSNSVGGGSNNRSSAITGISENTLNNSALTVFPNPSSGKIIIHYTTQTETKTEFVLLNNLGQLIKKILVTQNSSGENSLELDLNTMGIESGIYFLSAKIDAGTSTQKIVYSKN